MHMSGFASQKYPETHGAPRSLDEMRRDRLVLQAADEAPAKEAFESLFAGYEQRNSWCGEDQRFQRQLLGRRQWRRYWRAPHLCPRTRQENDTSRRRVELAIRHLATRLPDQRRHPARATDDHWRTEAFIPQNTRGLETNSSIYGNVKQYIWACP